MPETVEATARSLAGEAYESLKASGMSDEAIIAAKSPEASTPPPAAPPEAEAPPETAAAPEVPVESNVEAPATPDPDAATTLEDAAPEPDADAPAPPEGAIYKAYEHPEDVGWLGWFEDAEGVILGYLDTQKQYVEKCEEAMPGEAGREALVVEPAPVEEAEALVVPVDANQLATRMFANVRMRGQIQKALLKRGLRGDFRGWIAACIEVLDANSGGRVSSVMSEATPAK